MPGITPSHPPRRAVILVFVQAMSGWGSMLADRRAMRMEAA